MRLRELAKKQMGAGNGLDKWHARPGQTADASSLSCILLARWVESAASVGHRFGVGDLLIGALAAEVGALVWSADGAFDRMDALGFVGAYAASRSFRLPPSREALRRTRRSLGGGGQAEDRPGEAADTEV